MGYSDNKKAIRRVESYLKQMVESTKQLEFPSEDSSTLSYCLFEGIKTSAKFPEEPYLSYAKLGAKFKIRKRPDKVICEPRDISILTKSAELSSITIPDVKDALGIIGAAIKNKHPIMVFPSAIGLDDLGLKMLKGWGDKNQYFVVVKDDGIVLTKDESAREVAI